MAGSTRSCSEPRGASGCCWSVGGDRTLSATVNALGDRQATLGVLPLGTGNDFARSLRIPDDLEAACAVVAANHGPLSTKDGDGQASIPPFLPHRSPAKDWKAHSSGLVDGGAFEAGSVGDAVGGDRLFARAPQMWSESGAGTAYSGVASTRRLCGQRLASTNDSGKAACSRAKRSSSSERGPGKSSATLASPSVSGPGSRALCTWHRRRARP
ncbi:MAG: hypothetical protein HY901_35720 [Deltaproteobacteria bacterium]|nr:hypothetical protein [Deltaproteobacteria bacterium]